MLVSDFFVDIVAFFCNFCILIEVRLFLVSKFSRYSSQLLFLSQDGNKNEKKYHKSNFSRKGISKDTCWLWLWSVLLRKSSKHWASKLVFVGSYQSPQKWIKKKLKTLSIETRGKLRSVIFIVLLRKSSKHWASKQERFSDLSISPDPLRKSSKHWASKQRPNHFL